MIIKKNECEVYLPEKLTKSTFYSEDPFIIFEISPFLDENSYNDLVEEIYKLNDFDFVFDGLGEKKKRSINMSNVHQIQDGTLKNFCLSILSHDFFTWFKKTHLIHFDRKILDLQLSNPNTIFAKILRRILRFIPIPIGFYYTEIEYSSLTRDSFIPPHTDANKKRLSFVLYLPADRELSDAQKSELGTVFWKAKETAKSPLKRFDCRLLKGEERQRFYEEYEVLKIATYDWNKAACFIKSDISWHTVNKIASDYDRRAIVINVWQL